MNRKAYKLCRILFYYQVLSYALYSMFGYMCIGILVTLKMCRSRSACMLQYWIVPTNRRFNHYIFSMHRSVRYILLRKVDKQERNGDYPLTLYKVWAESRKNENIKIYVHVCVSI